MDAWQAEQDAELAAIAYELDNPDEDDEDVTFGVGSVVGSVSSPIPVHVHIESDDDDDDASSVSSSSSLDEDEKHLEAFRRLLEDDSPAVYPVCWVDRETYSFMTRMGVSYKMALQPRRYFVKHIEELDDIWEEEEEEA